jgi:nucleotide-binding universal stress UspA family protein
MRKRCVGRALEARAGAESSARRVQFRGKDHYTRRAPMTGPASTPIVVLVAVDDTSASVDAIHTAARLASMLRSAELHLVNVVAPVVMPLGDGAPAAIGLPIAEAIAAGQKLVAALAERAREELSDRIVTHVAVGAPVDAILQLSSDLGADVIVVGAHNRKALQRWLLGSVAEQVARKASCSVIVARPKDYSAGAPEIEPPCPACLAVPKATGREKLWCERHARHTVHGHLHYELPQPFAVGSMLLRPEG